MMVPVGRPGGRVTATNSTLRFLITVAYELGMPAQTRTTLIGAPNWVDSEHFDIEAETGGNPSISEKRLMIQSLLADRFKLVVHGATRQFPVFALVLAKGAKARPLLQPHRDDVKCFDDSGPPLPPPASGSNDPLPMSCDNFTVLAEPSWRLAGANVTMQMLAKTLSFTRGIDRAVVDRTGLSGHFDVRLSWTPQAVTAVPDAAAPPLLFTAIQQQLGVKLESAKGPVDVLVIDHVEESSPN